jgi:hypothetical protein
VLAGGEVGPGDINKPAGSSIGLTRVRSVLVTRPGNGPVMAGGRGTRGTSAAARFPANEGEELSHR